MNLVCVFVKVFVRDRGAMVEGFYVLSKLPLVYK